MKEAKLPNKSAKVVETKLPLNNAIRTPINIYIYIYTRDIIYIYIYHAIRRWKTKQLHDRQAQVGKRLTRTFFNPLDCTSKWGECQVDHFINIHLLGWPATTPAAKARARLFSSGFWEGGCRTKSEETQVDSHPTHP